MAKVYTSSFDIVKELEFYNTARNGGPMNISFFRQIASNRWTWIVQNWSDLKIRFEQAANGDQDLTADLEDLNREVQSWKIGSNINPLDNQLKLQQYDTFLCLISIDELKLTPDEVTNFNVELEKILQTDIESWRAALTFLRKEQALLAQAVGLGDPDAAKLLGISDSTKKREPTIDDLAKIDDIQNIYNVIEGVIFDLQQTTKRPPNLLQFANESITNDSDVSIVDTYLSYTSVPFEISLENMALKYLGSKDRWYELVTVNSLQPPFIDEKGTKISLLSNGSLNNIIISGDQPDLVYVNQKIKIGSDRIREEPRYIEQIIKNDNNTIILYLSGPRDLVKFKSSENAFIRVFTSGTTRNGEMISIPSSQPGFSPQSSKTSSDDNIRKLSRVLQNFGVDILHDEATGDILIDKNGNFKKAFGLKNVKQAVLNALKTEKGELDFHPSYGVNLAIGERYYGTVDEAMIFGQSLRDTLVRDPRFTNVLISNISSTGTGIAIELIVYLDGTQEPVTLSFVS